MVLAEMNTRHVLHVFSTFDLGGPEARFVSLVPRLGLDLHHTVLAMDGRYGAAVGLDQKNVSLLKLAVKKGAGVPNFKAFRTYLQQQRPDRIVTYNFGAFEWIFSNLLINIPHVHVEEGFGADETSKRFFRRNITRRVGFALSNSQLVTVSSGIAQIAQKEWGVSRGRISIIPNGIDAEEFDAVRPRIAPSIFAKNDKEFVIGTAARLRPEKRIDRLIDAFAMLCSNSLDVRQSFRLVIAGDGPEKSNLMKQAEALKLIDKIEFLGHRSDLPSLFANFDLFALTSDTEQMPISVLEAMASRLCIVSTDVGSISAMCAKSNAPFLTQRSVQSMYEKLLLAVQSPSILLSVGNDNFNKLSNEFSVKKMVASWDAIYRNT